MLTFCAFDEPGCDRANARTAVNIDSSRSVPVPIVLMVIAANLLAIESNRDLLPRNTRSAKVRASVLNADVSSVSVIPIPGAVRVIVDLNGAIGGDVSWSDIALSKR